MVESSQAQLVCVAEGIPQPTLSWEKDGNVLSESTGEYTILPSGELVIDIVQVRSKQDKQQIIYWFLNVCRLLLLLNTLLFRL